MQFVIAVISGILFGSVISKVIFSGSVYNLIPWAIVSLLFGLSAKNKKEAIYRAAVFGFVVSFTFMVTGYTGSQPLITRVLPFSVLGLFGAVCGGVLGIGGFLVRRLFKK